MLIEMLLMSSLLAGTNNAPQSANAADKCLSAEILMGAHRVEPLMPEREHRDGILPTPNADNRGPAVLLPDCKPEPIKRRKRKSDYPMA